tara:strand:+ start:4263 stop:4541 length:279 start_codon:yes stop_codon:yes gene_type:complete
MARSKEEERAISEKIAYLVTVDGLRPDRATAAAFRMFREGELTIGEPEPEIIEDNKEVEREFERINRRNRLLAKQKRKNVLQQFKKALQNLI